MKEKQLETTRHTLRRLTSEVSLLVEDLAQVSARMVKLEVQMSAFETQLAHMPIGMREEVLVSRAWKQRLGERCLSFWH